MKKEKEPKEQAVRQSRFPTSLFIILLTALLLMSGLHIGLIILMYARSWNSIIKIIVPIVYWVAVAIAITLYTRWQMQQSYEIPVQELAKATAKVAQGDFSVYVPPLHTLDKLDYLDVMIKDFNTMVEELGSIETLKTEFISNVSHEIKTPLSVIQNYTELLRSEDLTEEQRKSYMEMILHATKRLSNLITNILKLNKLEKQAIKPVPQAYDVSAQICECALQFEDMLDKKNIEFIADIEDRAIIQADEGLLELVWTNLLSNAIKFTPAGGSITVTQSSDAENITVGISDTGCGMDDNTLKRIFDKFYQGDTSHATEGNGLGLALVQRILQLSEGTIAVESVPGQGSTFTVMLPLLLYSEEEKEWNKRRKMP